jgi:sensor histidine kinase YesM
MTHPITHSRRNLIIYGLFWVLVAAMHGTFFYTFFDATITLSVVDAALYALFYGLLGLGLWYAVRYSQMETHNIGSLLLNHLTAVSITLSLLLLFGYFSMKSIPFINADYGEFFNRTLIWRIFTGIVEYVLLILVYYLIMYYANFIDKINKESELKTSVKVAELDALKSQINPHFLFNSLNSISALTVSESNKAREMIIKLSEFLRFSISEKPDSLRHFGDELENISRYLDIEMIRFGDKLEVKHDIAKKCHNSRVPSLILQPIIENAVKHGLSESLDKVEIKITADCFHGYLKIQVENDYDPVQPRRTNGSGIGLQNISQRMKLIYGRQDLVHVGSENNKFLVTLTFPQNGRED